MTVQVFTTGSTFRGLGRYLEHGQGQTYVEDPSERVAWTDERNLVQDDRRAAVNGMRAVSRENSRHNGHPIHVVISWKSLSDREVIQGVKTPDAPTEQEMKDTVHRVLEDERVGLGEHQAWIVAHKDTGTPHAHVMVNPVHPRTHKVWNGWMSIQRVNQVLRDVEAEKQWHTPEHGHQLAEEGYVERTRTFEPAMENAGRQEPRFEEAARAVVGEDLYEARSWEDVEEALKDYGLKAVSRRSGFAVTNGEHYAKMSSITGGVSRKGWEERFGTTWSEYMTENTSQEYDPEGNAQHEQGAGQEPPTGHQKTQKEEGGIGPDRAEEIDAEAFVASDRGRPVQWANRHYQENLRGLHEDHPAKQYLRERGIDEQTQERFGIGYAPERWRGTKNAGLRAGFSEETLRDADLTQPREDREKEIDQIRSRITFPINDEEGRTRGFAGRQVEGHEPGASAGTGKYRNSAQSEHFQKRSLAFGLGTARQGIEANGGEATVVEGYTDAMALDQQGQRNTVALMGTRLSPEVAVRMREAGVASATLAMDGDAEGRQAGFEGQETLVKQGVWAKTADLPEGRDPDEMMQTAEGRAAFAERMDARSDYVENVFEQAQRDVPGEMKAEVRTGANRRILDTAAQAPPETRRRLLECVVEHDREQRGPEVSVESKNAGERALRGAIEEEMSKRGVEVPGFSEARTDAARQETAEAPDLSGVEERSMGEPNPSPDSVKQTYEEAFGPPALSERDQKDAEQERGAETEPAQAAGAERPAASRSGRPAGREQGAGAREVRRTAEGQARRRQKLQGRAAWLEGRINRLEERQEERERTAVRARANQAEQRFEQSLAGVYADPKQARERFETLSRKHAFGKAMEQVRRRPEVLGPMRQDKQQAWAREKSRLTGQIENRSREHLALAAASAKVRRMQDVQKQGARDTQRNEYLQEEMQRSVARTWENPKEAAQNVQAHRKEHGWNDTWEKLGQKPQHFGKLNEERLSETSPKVSTREAARIEGGRVAGLMQAGRRLRGRQKTWQQDRGFAEQTMREAKAEMKELGARVKSVSERSTGGEKALWEKERADLEKQLAETNEEIRELSKRRPLEEEPRRSRPRSTPSVEQFRQTDMPAQQRTADPRAEERREERRPESEQEPEQRSREPEAGRSSPEAPAGDREREAAAARQETSERELGADNVAERDTAGRERPTARQRAAAGQGPGHRRERTPEEAWSVAQQYAGERLPPEQRHVGQGRAATKERENPSAVEAKVDEVRGSVKEGWQEFQENTARENLEQGGRMTAREGAKAGVDRATGGAVTAYESGRFAYDMAARGEQEAPESQEIDHAKVESAREDVEQFAQYRQAEAKLNAALESGDDEALREAAQEKQDVGGPSTLGKAQESWESLNAAEKKEAHKDMSDEAKEVVEEHEGSALVRQQSQSSGYEQGAAAEAGTDPAEGQVAGQNALSGNQPGEAAAKGEGPTVPQRPHRPKSRSKLRFAVVAGREAGSLAGAKDAGEDPTEMVESVARIGEAAIEAGGEMRDNKRMKEAIEQANARASYYQQAMGRTLEGEEGLEEERLEETDAEQEQAAGEASQEPEEATAETESPEAASPEAEEGEASTAEEEQEAAPEQEASGEQEDERESSQAQEQARGQAPGENRPEVETDAQGGDDTRESVSEQAQDSYEEKQALGSNTQDVMGGPKEDQQVNVRHVEASSDEQAPRPGADGPSREGSTAQHGDLQETGQDTTEAVTGSEPAEPDAAPDQDQSVRGDTGLTETQAQQVSGDIKERVEAHGEAISSGNTERAEQIEENLARNMDALNDEYGSDSVEAAMRQDQALTQSGDTVKGLSKKQQRRAYAAARNGRQRLARQVGKSAGQKAGHNLASGVSKVRTVAKTVSDDGEQSMGAG